MTENKAVKLRCPNCGNEDCEEMRWQEYVPHERHFELQGNKILVEDGESVIFEGGKDASLVCVRCGIDFAFPDGFKVEFC